MILNKVFYAYDTKLDKYVDVNEAQKRRFGDYICPDCKEPLIIRKGDKRVWHFAHKKYTYCSSETSLHIAAKKILQDSNFIYLPKRQYVLNNILGETVKIAKVDTEPKIENVRPDIVITLENRQQIAIEIAVTHKVESEKLEKLQKLGLSTIEIDLSNIDQDITLEELRIFILSDNEHKYWLYDSMERTVNTFVHNNTRILDFMPVNNELVFHRCPISARCDKLLNGIARYIDCKHCIFCYKCENDRAYCLGDLRIAEPDDIGESLQKLKQKYKSYENGFLYYIFNHRCPQCGRVLRWKTNEVDGSSFLGCKYPECKFTADPVKFKDYLCKNSFYVTYEQEMEENKNNGWI